MAVHFHIPPSLAFEPPDAGSPDCSLMTATCLIELPPSRLREALQVIDLRILDLMR